jgi:hypothetical protein
MEFTKTIHAHKILPFQRNSFYIAVNLNDLAKWKIPDISAGMRQKTADCSAAASHHVLLPNCCSGAVKDGRTLLCFLSTWLGSLLI